MGARRRCVVVRGTREQTRQAATRRIEGLPRDQVIWDAADAPDGARVVPARKLDTLLGQSVDAAVLDLHGPLDPEALARAAGLVRGGGALVLRMEPEGAPLARRADLAVHPFSVQDVGERFARRFERLLPADELLAQGEHRLEGTPEQDALVAELAAMFEGEPAAIAVVQADRGRGKSAALGRALHTLRTPGLRVAVTGPRPEAVAEVLRFAESAVGFVEPSDLADPVEARADVVVIDEAAQLPVALLKRIVTAHPRARIALATTCHGYEGTGRGFALRFARWIASQGRPLRERTLRAPIRWDADDPVERWIYDALLLDAEPAVLGPVRSPVHVVIDRDRLVDDARLLRQLHGLFVHAHYRTTPSDLVRMLDAPNLEIHALLEGGLVVGASLIAREGGLPAPLAADMRSGARRVAGHALADTLVSHGLRDDAAALSMIRSVRIAVHEERRGRGYARQLVEAVHARHAPDLFGTIFGATPELVRFRQALGYQVVRLGVARGARSGEPAVVMVRPVSARAEAMVRALRVDLSRELDAQLALMASDDGAPVSLDLREALRASLPLPVELDDALVTQLARAYAESTQPLDVVAATLTRFVLREDLRDPVLRARLVDRLSWRQTAARASLPSVEAAMRRARAAILAALPDGD